MSFSPEKKSPTANLILAIVILNALGTLVLFIKTELDSRQSSQEVGIVQQQLAGSAKATKAMPVVNGDNGASTGWKTYGGWDLKFNYPSTFLVTPYPDEFTGGQMDIRITSQKGELVRSSGGPVDTSDSDRPFFSSGYQMSIKELTTGRSAFDSDDKQSTPTSNPLVQRIPHDCDFAGCDYEKFLVTSKKGSYLVHVFASSDFKNEQEVTDGIIRSITE